MQLQTLHDASIKGLILAQQTKVSVDVFEVSEGNYKYSLTALRKSGKFVKRYTHEKGAIKVVNMDGKVLETIGGAEKSDKPKKSTEGQANK